MLTPTPHANTCDDWNRANLQTADGVDILDRRLACHRQYQRLVEAKTIVVFLCVYKRGLPYVGEEFLLFSGLNQLESLILFQIGSKKGQKTCILFVEHRLLRKIRRKTRAKQNRHRRIQSMVNIGDQRKCPECETMGSVVWVSLDKSTMGVRCHMSHRETSKPASRYGGKIAVSTKTRKNVVFITAVAPISLDLATFSFACWGRTLPASNLIAK